MPVKETEWVRGKREKQEKQEKPKSRERKIDKKQIYIL